MPSIRKLSPDEIDERKHGKLSQRALVSREYDAMLGQFDIGDWGEVVVDPSEKRLTIRNRLQGAAERKNVKLRFFRTQGPVIRFEVQHPSSNGQDDESDDDEEYLPGVRAAAAPITDPTGRRIAAIVVVGFKQRMDTRTLRRIGERCAQVARDLSARLVDRAA